MSLLIIQDINGKEALNTKKIIALKIYKGYDEEKRNIRSVILSSASVVNNSLLKIYYKNNTVKFIYLKSGIILENKIGTIIKSFDSILRIDKRNYKLQALDLYAYNDNNLSQNNYNNIIKESQDELNLINKNTTIPSTEDWKIYIYILVINKEYNYEKK